MAFSKKVSRRRYRSSRYRRRYRRRRYRRYNYRKRYRRTRRFKPEYKRVEFDMTSNFKINSATVQNELLCLVTPRLYEFVCIGSEGVLETATKQIPIRVGAGINQRVGAKIRPTGLRITGTISIEAKNQPDNPGTGGLNNIGNVNACMVRLIVMQVRNGNTAYNPLAGTFSGVNPFIGNAIRYDNKDYELVQYNGEATDYYCSPEWFNKFFAFDHGMRHLIETQEIQQENGGVRRVAAVWDGYTAENRYKSGIYAKSPYRSGIGSGLKILKDKLYYCNPTTAPTFAIRTRTKRPYRMVWRESQYQDNQLDENCKNPIYIIVMPIYPVGVNIDKLAVDLNVQFYYTDT